MVKYHFSTKTNMTGVCKADKKACQYKSYDTLAEAKMEETLHRAATATPNTPPPGVTKPPVILEPSLYKEPTDVEGEAVWDYDNVYSTSDPYYGDDEDDYYHEGYDYYNDGGGFYEQYENLRLTSVDAETTVKHMLQVNAADALPAELKQLIKDNKWDDIENWGVHTEPSYDREIPVVDKPEGMFNEVQKWYWNQPNAEDKKGVLNYVRSKGTETAGLTPLEAIKKQLAEENPGKRHRGVENAATVDQRKIRLADIFVPKPARLRDVDGQPAVDHQNKVGLSGVVLKQGDSYRLVDGYHRLKDLNDKNRVTGRYLILS